MHGFDNSNDDVDYSFDYNLANQVSFRTVNNDTYQFAPVAREETYTANGLNQYTQIMKDQVLIGLTYDANGNLTGDGTWTYTYDVENRLLNATDGSTDVDYVYDPLGRRVKKDVNGQDEVFYLSDGTEEILELNDKGDTQNRYVFGPGVDEPVLMYTGDRVSNNKKRYYRADPQGSIIALTNDGGDVIDTYTYDAYGNPDNPGGNAIRYTGRRWDAETGLYYYRARMYNPSLGRFLQTDPVGYADNLLLYGYVGNDPTNKSDPTGKIDITTEDGITTVKRTPTEAVLFDLAPPPLNNATVTIGVTGEIGIGLVSVGASGGVAFEFDGDAQLSNVGGFAALLPGGILQNFVTGDFSTFTPGEVGGKLTGDLGLRSGGILDIAGVELELSGQLPGPLPFTIVGGTVNLGDDFGGEINLGLGSPGGGANVSIAGACTVKLECRGPGSDPVDTPNR